MKTIFAIVIGAALLFLAAVTGAQLAVTVGEGKFTFNWAPGKPGVDDGPVTEWQFRCGPQPGKYVIKRTVEEKPPLTTPAVKSFLVRDILPVSGGGVYYCVIVAANSYVDPATKKTVVQEAAPSNEVVLIDMILIPK